MLPRFLDKGGWWRAWPTQDDCCEVMVSTAAGGQPTHEGLRNHAFQNRKRRRPANPLEAATTTIAIQTQLDAILPLMLPVLVTALAYWLLKRGWSPIAVLGVLFAIGFIGGAIGFFG